MQDLIAQQKELVLRIINSEIGRVYLCGNSAMSKSVQAALRKIIAEDKSITDKQAEEAFFKLQEEKRICIEAWG